MTRKRSCAWRLLKPVRDCLRSCFLSKYSAGSRASPVTIQEMEIHELRYFVAVAEEGSFSHAAEREHVSQPSLSQQIQKLEAELNQQLFDRLPRSVVLTEAGRSLLPYARQILSAIADAGLSVAALEHEV